MDCAERFFAPRLVPEKRARVGEDIKDTFIEKELDLIGVDGYSGLFPRVLVEQNKPVFPKILFYAVDVPELAAAVSALEALEGRDTAPATGCSARWQGQIQG